MIKVINSYGEKKLTVAEILDCNNPCILKDGRIAFSAWMDVNLFNKLNKKGSILCFTIDDSGKTCIEYIRDDTPATPCNVKITVD